MWIRIALSAFILWALLPAYACAQEKPQRPVLRDDAAGYILLLPAGWQEVTDPSRVEQLRRRVCDVFVVDGAIAGSSRMRAAVFPDDAATLPALVVFALDYASLGLSQKAVQDMSKDAQTVTAALANALQTSYMQRFPQTIMINNHLEEESFSLNLRTVLDFADERGTTRNRHIKMMLTAGGALVLATQYDGLPNAAYDSAIAASVREMLVLPEKSLQRVNPPYQAGFLDYALLVVAIFIIYVVVRKLRAALR